MTETGSTVERLRELSADSGLEWSGDPDHEIDASVSVPVTKRELRALLAVVEAAQTFRKLGPNWTYKDMMNSGLEDSLAALHSQAFDEGKHG